MPLSHAIGPQLQFDCGSWTIQRDSKGFYRELTTSALYEFSGSSFKYKIYFYGSTREVRKKISRGQLNWTHKIQNPEYDSRIMEVPISMKFRNNKMQRFMYKTKFIRADVLFTDEQEFEAREVCIWKWK